MHSSFNIVRGAVSSKDLVPVLTHFAWHSATQRLYGFNGRVHISTPCTALAQLDSFTVPAAAMLAAIDACEDPVVTLADGALMVQESAFRAVLPTGSITDFPIPLSSSLPDELLPPSPPPLLPVLTTLYPFIGEDASRPWCASIKFTGTAALATNNTSLAILPCITSFSAVLPVFAIDELLRLKQEPLHVQQEEAGNALLFHLPGATQLRTLLIEDAWPDAARVWDAAVEGAEWCAVQQDLLAAVQRVQPFCPDAGHPAIVLEGDAVKTLDGAMSARVSGFDALRGSYYAPPLLAVLACAKRAAWNRFPRVPWEGDAGLHGVIVGLAGAKA